MAIGTPRIATCQGTKRAAEFAVVLASTSYLLGVLAAPFSLSLILGAAGGTINTLNLVAMLLIAVLCPALLGKSLQIAVPRCVRTLMLYDTVLTLFQSANVVLLIWQAVSKDEHLLRAQSLAQISICLCCSIVLHILFWLMNSPVLSMSYVEDMHHRRAIFHLACLKDLGFSLAVISGLSTSVSWSPALLAVPVVLGFVMQIFMDSYFIDVWARHPCENLLVGT
eukprot:gnl/TRDRNA2_/TRDRNA2_155963_c0_seq1.p1 gnl/TRDRNA2_/TRDRNA2_155963_c0~~gnl/TRDRNA2_/TRDRNA2_155963_c0_seq1.p1  ORF type:complete len:224 (-),score=23.17 gnl/TRDRNA2_/TRDRNA2_155963_c0_seq1:20-691(-)